MNKNEYQEALNETVTMAKLSGADRDVIDYNENKLQQAIDKAIKYDKLTVKDMLNLTDFSYMLSDKIQQLVDKETPMKPIIMEDWNLTLDDKVKVCYCNDCKKSIRNWAWKPTYCEHCQRKLDWSDNK